MIEIYSASHEPFARVYCSSCASYHWAEFSTNTDKELFIEFESKDRSTVKTRLKAAVAARRRTGSKEMHVFLDKKQAMALVGEIKQKLQISAVKPAKYKPIESLWPEDDSSSVEKGFFKEVCFYKDLENKIEVAYTKRDGSYFVDFASVIAHGKEISTSLKTILVYTLYGELYPFLGRSTEVERPSEFLWALEKVIDELDDVG